MNCWIDYFLKFSIFYFSCLKYCTQSITKMYKYQNYFRCKKFVCIIMKLIFSWCLSISFISIWFEIMKLWLTIRIVIINNNIVFWQTTWIRTILIFWLYDENFTILRFSIFMITFKSQKSNVSLKQILFDFW